MLTDNGKAGIVAFEIPGRRIFQSTKTQAACPCMKTGGALALNCMSDESLELQRNSSWSRTLLRVALICGGSVAILLPAWLPNRPKVPIESGTVELLQASLLAAAAAVMFGASSHAGVNRPVCRVLALGFFAAFVVKSTILFRGPSISNFPQFG